MSKNEVKLKIIEALRETGRENIENVISYMDAHGFFENSCHGHHHYRGGLADHAWQTYQFALKEVGENSAVDKSSLAICCLLHDFCKCGGLWSLPGHGERSARMIQKLGVHLSGPEFLAIRFHMSLHRHKSHFLYPEALACRLRHYVHQADLKSARMQIGSEI